MLSRFLRSAIHATVSTLIGCSANNPATIALRAAIPVARCSTRKSSSTFKACSARLTSCGPAGPGVNRSASSACDSHASGCQSGTSGVVVPKEVNAHFTVSQLTPARTCGFE